MVPNHRPLAFRWVLSSSGQQIVLRGNSQGPAVIDHVGPPDYLSSVAADLWQDLMPELTAVGMLTTLDLIGFGQLCEAYADWSTARATLAANGGNYYMVGQKTDAAGKPVPNTGTWKLHPAYYAVSDADRRIRGWCQEFGLSPAVRMRFGARAPVKDPRPNEVEDEFIDFDNLNVEEREALRTIAERRMVEGQEAREQ